MPRPLTLRLRCWLLLKRLDSALVFIFLWVFVWLLVVKRNSALLDDVELELRLAWLLRFVPGLLVLAGGGKARRLCGAFRIFLINLSPRDRAFHRRHERCQFRLLAPPATFLLLLLAVSAPRSAQLGPIVGRLFLAMRSRPCRLPILFLIHFQ